MHNHILKFSENEIQVNIGCSLKKIYLEKIII